VALAQQSSDQVRPDEASPARDERNGPPPHTGA
jgi:hypothetical protein